KPTSHGDIWVYVEHRFGVPKDVSWELMAEGQRIAEAYGFHLAAVVLGDDVSNVIQDAFAHGAERVYTVSNPVLGAYRTKPYAEALSALIRKHKPEALFVGASPNGRDLVGAVVTMVETGAIADCTMIDVDDKFGVQGTRPDFGGKEMSTIVCPKHRPIALTVRPRVFRVSPADYSRKGDVVYEEVPLDESSVPTRVLDFVETRKMGVKLESAPVIVAGGRGLGSPKNLPLLEDFAKSLGGVVGATRAIVYLGWIAKDYQIGQTGYTVRPRLYVAVGLSGAIQHVVGMQNSDIIIAINKDPQAPIFSVTDFGIVGDLFEVVPAFMKELENRGLDERSRHG
ncbi:MAG: electron transfer flavoprotein subunit alpha/FixB family protein, partial [Candidatus Bathyarchaeia archaeon]